MNLNKNDTLIDEIEEKKLSWDYDWALQVALNALKKDLNDYRIYEELADIYIFQENLTKAEEVIAYARELHPDSGTGLFLEGYILSEKWDYEKAKAIFQKANMLFPNNAEIIRNIGWCFVMLGNMDQGIIFLERARALAPDDEKILSNIVATRLLISDNSKE